MDTMNNNQNNKSQNELDLGLNQAEPVTPRKPVQSGESLFDKAKGLFGRKEQPETQFHVRKEPTFGESSAPETQPLQQPIFEPTFKATAEQVEQKMEEDVESHAETIAEKVETKAEEIKENVAETMEQAKEKLSAGASAASSALKRPEKWKVLQILPEKHRRLFIAVLALVVLLIVFFALKPNSDTVESFEQQSNEIPVQFQSLDQSQPVETTVLDGTTAPQENAPAAEQQAQTETSAPAEPGKMEYMGDAQKDAVNSAQPAASAPMAAKEAAPQVAPAAPVRSEPTKAVEHNAVEPRHETVKREAIKHETAKPEAQKTAVQERRSVEKAVTKPVPAKVEKAETAHKVPVQEAKVAAKNERKVQIVEAKPAGSAGTVKATTTSSASKTLTVPQGVSLMQVFRDNNLNISDVNAMTKANGAGNALSSFKPGDKVQISLNSQGRVSELRLSNGAKFVRQADGSYQYKK